MQRVAQERHNEVSAPHYEVLCKQQWVFERTSVAYSKETQSPGSLSEPVTAQATLAKSAENAVLQAARTASVFHMRNPFQCLKCDIITGHCR